MNRPAHYLEKEKKMNKTLLDFMSELEYKHIKMIYFKIHFWGSGG